MLSDVLSLAQGRLPDVSFVTDTYFGWSPEQRQIFYNPSKKGTGASLSLLHEVAHALLGHHRYRYDVELVRFEVAAWTRTVELAEELELPIADESIERCLDSYRDWLDARSRCPHCNQTGIQQSNQLYRCIACSSQWRVPIKQTCVIKRYKL